MTKQILKAIRTAQGNQPFEAYTSVDGLCERLSMSYEELSKKLMSMKSQGLVTLYTEQSDAYVRSVYLTKYGFSLIS